MSTFTSGEFTNNKAGYVEPRRELNYVSLFSSAGVGCYGFKQEGFKGIVSSELIERRLNIQKANNKLQFSDGYILGDITNSDVQNRLHAAIHKYSKETGDSEIDVVVFTAPCQGMSVANHKKCDSTLDRNSLVVEALDVVSRIRPRFFIAENVRSFLRTKCVDRDEVKTIAEAFDDWLSTEYLYTSKVLNFKDYGANSSRTRTLVVGVRKDLLCSITPDELFPQKKCEKTLREIIGHLPSLEEMGMPHRSDIFHNFKSYRKDMRDWIHEVSPGKSAFDNTDPNKRPHRRCKDGLIVPNVNKNGDKYKRQRWDNVAPCVHTRNDIMASQNTVHPADDRVFSIRELMIMMNIPSSFKWVSEDESLLNNLPVSEKISFLKKHEINIRQSIGEAVPTVIMREMAKNIKNASLRIDS
ncbi:MAG: DNA cytosine methyltransferase [Coriobacteriia bacterium]|nr:DNA cytosine methyltransferase [Coriobacteriia bacterium]MCL2746407.1 DNA cytosine methyltransferase [Coriobacteriia bacterium]